MNSRILVYRFGFRLACLIVLLIALSIMAMTYFFITSEPEATKEISRWFEKIVMALVALLGGIVIRTVPMLSEGRPKTSGIRRLGSLPHKSRSQLRDEASGAIVSKATGQLGLKGKGNGGRSRRGRDLKTK